MEPKPTKFTNSSISIDKLMVTNDHLAIQKLQEAITLHQMGQLAEAESIYRQLLRIKYTKPDSLHLIGVIAYQNGKYQRNC